MTLWTRLGAILGYSKLLMRMVRMGWEEPMEFQEQEGPNYLCVRCQKKTFRNSPSGPASQYLKHQQSQDSELRVAL